MSNFNFMKTKSVSVIFVDGQGRSKELPREEVRERIVELHNNENLSHREISGRLRIALTTVQTREQHNFQQ